MTKPAWSDIVPTRDGVVMLEPTPEIRWFIDGKLRVLQQLWRDRDTGSPYWRDVPEVKRSTT